MTKNVNKPFMIIAFGVLLAHVGLLSWLSYTTPFVPKPLPPQRLVVQTMQLQEPKKAEPIAQAPPKPKPKTESKPKPKPKTESKLKPKPKTESKPKNKPPVNKKKQELLAKAREKIAKIQKSHDNVATNVSRLEKLQIDALPTAHAPQLTIQEIGYRDELVQRLRLLLRLPEEGDVQVKLTVKRSGLISNVTIVKASSTTNRAYIEKTLPTLTLPQFGKHFGNLSEYTFLITLSSEI